MSTEPAERYEAAPAGSELNRLSVSATTHCLSGWVIGEVSGMALGTAFGWGNLPTTLAAIGLAFFFGYGLTSLPLFRAGLSLSTVAPIAFGSDTVSIAIMEAVDNGFILAIPGAMDAGLGDVLFWAASPVASRSRSGRRSWRTAT